MTANLDTPGLPVDEASRVRRIAEKCKEAIGLTTDDTAGDVAFEAMLDEFIAKHKSPSATVLPLIRKPGEGPAPDLAPPEEASKDASPSPLANSQLPTQPVTEVFDPRRPHFGKKQVRSLDGLDAGLKLRVCGRPKAVIELHGEENIAVSTIVNEHNKSGEVTIVSAPFEVGSAGRKVIIVKYTGSTLLGNKKDATARIYLDELSVLPYAQKQNAPAVWRTEVWLERL